MNTLLFAYSSKRQSLEVLDEESSASKTIGCIGFFCGPYIPSGHNSGMLAVERNRGTRPAILLKVKKLLTGIKNGSLSRRSGKGKAALTLVD